MGQDGFKNEDLMLEALNNKKFMDLNDNLKQMILDMYGEEISQDFIIKAYKKGGVNKTDLTIDINSQNFNVSIKKGTGNSVHQEKLEEFVSFLKEEYGISNVLSDDIRFFIWGDGTLDGTGEVSDRLSASEFRKQFPEKIRNIREFFYTVKRDLIERFVIKGPKSKSRPDFIYYGTPDKGIIVESQSVIDWLSDDKNEKSSSPIPIGRLTFQAWNRNINGGDKSENKRGVIQLKWSSVGKDLVKIYKEKKDDK
ncbi:hypothetical protein mru_0024 [Methanobrevibacter ruminantium M1]|uniref:Uncharacterized protein n=1 Tax=Methanobrevibacter ruminantium (strain ATCC 35063 / DSM 1093 / JCM 13430 / OCM 146 / M1) TaxID=634498 RepID=D3E4I0_METRM|nr:hypothetical protein [Methanobrevibacter ruminantium]ADC45876.1 hypothetical protein mru_0024 [Methanobrevibacter ruminantium M1]